MIYIIEIILRLMLDEIMFLTRSHQWSSILTRQDRRLNEKHQRRICSLAVERSEKCEKVLVVSSSATRNVRVELWSWQVRTLRTIGFVERSYSLIAF